MDLRTIAEKLARGLYPFGVSGDAAEAAAAVRADVQLVWSNCRSFNPVRSCIVGLLDALETEFDLVWSEWIEQRADGWRPWLRPAAAKLVPMPHGGRLPKIVAEPPATAGGGVARKPRRQFHPPPPPSLSTEELQALTHDERQHMLQRALPNRAPPPPGWDADDVGGVPWHLRAEYLTPAAMEARRKCEECMRDVLAETKRAKEEAMTQAEAAANGTRIVTAAVGRRVFCRPKERGPQSGQPEAREAYGVYQVDGRVLEDSSRRALSVADFVALAGESPRPLPPSPSPPLFLRFSRFPRFPPPPLCARLVACALHHVSRTSCTRSASSLLLVHLGGVSLGTRATARMPTPRVVCVLIIASAPFPPRPGELSAGLTSKRPLRAIMLQPSPGSDDEELTSLEYLLQLHGSTDVKERAANAQADPHCTLCGGGESEAGNEILLCDGLQCAGCYHQQCTSPPVEEVPEGAWLCSTCVAAGNGAPSPPPVRARPH